MRTRRAEQDSGPKKVFHAATRGVVGALAMSGLREFTQSLGLLSETPPHAIVGRKGRAMLRKVPPPRRRAVIETAHYGYGAMGGSVFGVLPMAVRSRPWAGPLYGMVLWAVYEAGIAPALGLQRFHRSSPVEWAMLAGDHLLYGFVLSEMRRRPQA